MKLKGSKGEKTGGLWGYSADTFAMKICAKSKRGGVDHFWRQGIPLPRRSGEEGVEAVVFLACCPVKGLCVGALSSLGSIC